MKNYENDLKRNNINTIKMSTLIFQTLMIIGILLGNALSVIIPYFRKLSENKIDSFDYKYLYHAISSVIWQSLVSLPLWIGWEAPSGLSWLLAFILSVSFGFGGKSMQEQIYRYTKKTKISTNL